MNPPPSTSKPNEDGTGPASTARLTLEELAARGRDDTRADPPARRDRGHRPGGGRHFGRGDVIRSRVVGAFEVEGFSLDQMARAIREHAIGLWSLELFYPDPSPRTGRTYGEFIAEVGPRGQLVGQVLSAMGLSAPPPEAPTRVAEEANIRALIEGWSVVDEEFTLRAARIFGEAARRAAEGWVALFAEAVSEPIEANFTTLEDVLPRLVEPAAVLANLGPPMLAWLLQRHLERTMNDVNIGRIERRLVNQGLLPSKPSHPPAVAFVDLSGYTSLTVERGDEHGAITSVRLGELAEAVVRRKGGRVVKLLGDGVLLLFDSPCSAIETVAELAREMLKAGLPAAHAGLQPAGRRARRRRLRDHGQRRIAHRSPRAGREPSSSASPWCSAVPS